MSSAPDQSARSVCCIDAVYKMLVQQTSGTSVTRPEQDVRNNSDRKHKASSVVSR